MLNRLALGKRMMTVVVKQLGGLSKLTYGRVGKALPQNEAGKVMYLACKALGGNLMANKHMKADSEEERYTQQRLSDRELLI